MSPSPPPKPDPQWDAIEFESTDFDDARRALDDLPPGLAELQKSRDGWKGRRRDPLPTDRALTGAAMDWVIHLPPSLRPHTACDQFPRVVNAIAASWDDLSFSLRVIDHMINDYRGGRRGFPLTVQAELRALYQHQRRRAGG